MQNLSSCIFSSVPPLRVVCFATKTEMRVFKLLLPLALSVLSSHASLLPQISSPTTANTNLVLLSTDLNLTSLTSAVTNLSDYREQSLRLYQHNAQLHLIIFVDDENRIPGHTLRTALSGLERAVAAEAFTKGSGAVLTGPVKAFRPAGSSGGCWIIANTSDQVPAAPQKLTYGILSEAVHVLQSATRPDPFVTYVDILEGVDLTHPGPRIGMISMENKKPAGWDSNMSVSEH